MATPLAETLLGKLKAAMEGITGLSHVNRGKWVAPQVQRDQDDSKFPYINMGRVQMVPLASAQGRTYKRLSVQVEGYVPWSAATGFSDAQQLLSDIEAAVTDKPRHGGDAYDTTVLAQGHAGILDQHGFIAVQAEIAVDYGHAHADPTSQ